MILGQYHIVQDTFWYRPECLPDEVFLYVEQFIVDSLDTRGNVLRCYTHLQHRTTTTKNYLNTFHPNQTINSQSFRPFGVFEFSDKLGAYSKNFTTVSLNIKVQRSFWIHLMIHRFDMDVDIKKNALSCRQVYMSISTRDYYEHYCGKKRPWDQV